MKNEVLSKSGALSKNPTLARAVFSRTEPAAKTNPLPATSFPLGRTLSVLAKMYVGALTKKLEDLDIDKHYSLLMLIEARTSDCTQQYLCEELQVDKASMVRFIDYLVKKGLVQRTQCQEDRREHHIMLTANGKEVLEKIHEGVKEMNHIAFRGINAVRQKEFYNIMASIKANLELEPSYKVILNYKKLKSEALAKTNK